MTRFIKNLCLVFAALLTVTFGAFAQKVTVSGTVRDQGGEPMAGAAVAVQTTTQGVMTDLDGRYSIQVAPDAVLEFSRRQFCHGFSIRCCRKEGRSDLVYRGIGSLRGQQP